MVVLDHDSRQLVLRNTHSSNGDLELTDCPYCHRPMRDADPTRGRSGHHSSEASGQPEFINPNYFRMLHNSLPNSTESSASSSPRRRFVQPALANGPTSFPDQSRKSGISSAAFSQDYFKKFFVEETELGRGGKGVVLLVKHVLDGVSLGHYACKRVPVGDDHEWLEKVLGEVQLLQHLSHQNLVSYRHVWLENAKLSTFGPSVPCAFILQQYCNAGDLHRYIYGSTQTSATAQLLKERIRRRSRGEPDPAAESLGPRKLNFEEIYTFFRDITSGLRHLHVNGYIHRDLKPSNCLLHETGDGLRVLVSDFGEVQSQHGIRKSTGSTGTVSFCAPEVLRRETPDGPFGNFTFKSDIFSLGMILYFLCFTELPYLNADIINEEKEDLDKLRDEISQWSGFDDAQKMRPYLPEKLYTFLKRLLSVDPSRRPTADEILTSIQAGVPGGESFRFKRSSSSSPDVQSNTRIRPLDNLAQGNSRPPVSPTKMSRNSVALRRGSIYDSANMQDANTPSAEIEPERSRTFSPERDLIVRPRLSGPSSLSPSQIESFEKLRSDSGSPSRDNHDQQMENELEAEAKNENGEQNNMQEHSFTPHLLPPPPDSWPRNWLAFFSFPSSLSSPSRYSSAFVPLMQLGIFLVKVVSAFQPCSPLSTNPWVFYPLLLLAVVNLRTRSFKSQALALVVHLLTIFLSIRMGALCIRYPASTMLSWGL